MKALIICFSQTGNTWKVAEHIREGILETFDECNLIGLKETQKDDLKNYDLVGLGCPVFYYKEPFHVRQFIEDLPELSGRQWFVFCSHGSVMGMTLISMTRRLQEKGILVIGSHHTYADATLPFYPYPTVTTGHPDDQDLEAALACGKHIATCSLAVSKGDRTGVAAPSPVTEDWVTGEAEMLSEEFLGRLMPKLSINTEKCTSCGACMAECPVEGIDIYAEPPVIQMPCIYCWGCVNLCPVCAIEADWSRMTSMAPANYRRYIQALHEAEDRGEFRWHVDPDTIDYDNPLFKQRLGEIAKK
jgi:flavodoxin/ferredoxin